MTAAAQGREVHEIAVEAYIYLYPLVAMDVWRRVVTNLAAGVKPGVGPMNVFHHVRAFPPADFRLVPLPNFDTLWSLAWLNLAREPVIVSVPDAGGRFYLLPMLDMWTEVFAAPGTRTRGGGAADFAIVARGWNGALPHGVERFEAPTRFVRITGRIRADGAADYPNVHRIQDGFSITPLSQWGRRPRPVVFSPDPSVDMRTEPARQVDAMPADRFFAYAATLMTQHPPRPADSPMVERIKRIGLEPGQAFEPPTSSPGVADALEAARHDALEALQARAACLGRSVNGWQVLAGTAGVDGNRYLDRAAVARTRLGADRPEDVVVAHAATDGDGRPLEGGRKYVVRFPGGGMPSGAFWSLTAYDPEFPVPNPINRYAIGGRDRLAFNPDGSLDIHVQPESPGRRGESNWLPSPHAGPMSLAMRIYAPAAEVVDGRWAPPAVRAVPEPLGAQVAP